VDTIIFLTIYFIITISILGYGLFFSRLININFFSLNYGYIGLIGISFLVLISYISHMFLAHNYLHNVILHICGILFFLFFHFKNKANSTGDIKILIFVFLIFLIAIFLSKNNEDFPYYHFPFAWNLVQNKLQFGQGLFNLGYRHHSSLLYFNSLTYLPFVKYYLFTSTNLIFFSLINLIFFQKVLEKQKEEKFDFIFFLSLFFLIFFISIFNRLADFGTDKAGQMIAILLVVQSLEIINLKHDIQKIKLNFQVIIILLLLLITLKVYFLIYSLLIFLIIYQLQDKLELFKTIFFSKITVFGFILLLSFVILNVSNNGCIIYPISSTCFIDVFPWSLDKESLEAQNIWLQQWAKGGAGPNFRIENPEIYIQKLNWVSHWIGFYFFTKVSDFLLSLTLIVLILSVFFFRKKNKEEKIVYFKLIYIYILCIFLYWFYKHPQLRYGGFNIIALIIFIPLSIRFSNSIMEYKSKRKAVFFLIFLSLSIFLTKNAIRIKNEFERNDQYKYINFPFYYISEENLNSGLNDPEEIKKKYHINTKVINGYTIYYR